MVYPIDDIDFNCLVKVAFVKFLHCNVSIFPFVKILIGDTLRVYKYLASHLYSCLNQ
jgi:hypothetical protein